MSNETTSAKTVRAVNGQFVAGEKRLPDAGRVAGTPNKTTAAVKDAILNAFETVGGQQYLVMVALSDPKTFCTLLGRVLPAELKLEGGDGPIQVQFIQRTIVEPKPVE